MLLLSGFTVRFLSVCFVPSTEQISVTKSHGRYIANFSSNKSSLLFQESYKPCRFINRRRQENIVSHKCIYSYLLEISERNICTVFRVWEWWTVTELNVRIAWIIGQNDPCRRLFQVQSPLPPGFPEYLTPPPARISRIPSVGGVRIFSWTTQYLIGGLSIIFAY